MLRQVLTNEALEFARLKKREDRRKIIGEYVVETSKVHATVNRDALLRRKRFRR